MEQGLGSQRRLDFLLSRVLAVCLRITLIHLLHSQQGAYRRKGLPYITNMQLYVVYILKNFSCAKIQMLMYILLHQNAAYSNSLYFRPLNFRVNNFGLFQSLEKFSAVLFHNTWTRVIETARQIQYLQTPFQVIISRGVLSSPRLQWVHTQYCYIDPLRG